MEKPGGRQGFGAVHVEGVFGESARERGAEGHGGAGKVSKVNGLVVQRTSMYLQVAWSFQRRWSSPALLLVARVTLPVFAGSVLAVSVLVSRDRRAAGRSWKFPSPPFSCMIWGILRAQVYVSFPPGAIALPLQPPGRPSTMVCAQHHLAHDTSVNPFTTSLPKRQRPPSPLAH